MAITVYGIKNCDTMKKALKWLDEQGLEYHFHDYKKDGVPEAQLRRWIDALG
ncbi:MAG TPA: arsenate reductase, partial [Alcanivorax sp.]|nr:arsenate reductase [Alcanivorax sp.]